MWIKCTKNYVVQQKKCQKIFKNEFATLEFDEFSGCAWAILPPYTHPTKCVWVPPTHRECSERKWTKIYRLLLFHIRGKKSEIKMDFFVGDFLLILLWFPTIFCYNEK